MNDMTTGSPIKKIIRFSIPLIMGNLFQLFYNMVDTFIVGRSIGLNALAGVGLAGIAELVMRVIAAFVLTPMIGFSGTVLSNPMPWLGSLIILIPAFYRKHYELKQLRDL
ncbi:hypothetical protein [Facklamia sp. P9177]|uniref:hypothetical protein n=1 Tax=Facklamia sp. P9177 TaxID=3421945 RepID=UPI003D181735